MRIIAGTHRARTFKPPRDAETTRPMPDRVKEAVFSRLNSLGMLAPDPRQPDRPWHAADAFAGTGSMGLEFLSRGAGHCVFVEADRDATLLSGGQLASLGEYLGTWVGKEDPQPEPQEASEPVEPMLPAAHVEPPATVQLKPTQPTVHEWDVTVMRGDHTEVQSFRTKKENEESNPLF